MGGFSMRSKTFWIAVILLYTSISLFAQTTGRLTGRVIDNRRNPVAYANVYLQGTNNYASTDDRGRYSIINITPGTYTLIVSMVGYQGYKMENVRISVDETRTIDITIQSTSVEMEAITVVAPDELLKIGGGSTTSRSAEDLKNVAVTDVAGVIALTPGVNKQGSDLHFRGGRANEVVYTVDGMSISDPVDGGRAISVDLDAIADMKVMTGGFTAEYGNAQSGMVNIVTKDGTDIYEGKIEVSSDHLFSEGANSDEVKFALGGPLPIYFFNEDFRKKFTFYLNGAGQWDDTRYRKYYKNDPYNDMVFAGQPLLNSLYDDPLYVNDPYSKRDKVLGFELGNRNNNNYNLNLKTTFAITPTQKFTLALRGDRSYSQPFSFQRMYTLQHYAESEINSRQYMFTYDHVFDAKRTLQVKGSYYSRKQFQNPRNVDTDHFYDKRIGWDDVYTYVDDDGNEIPTDQQNWQRWAANGEELFVPIIEYGWHSGYNPSGLWYYNVQSLNDPVAIPGFFAPGYVWDNLIDDEAQQYSVKADFEYQVSQVVGTKTGFEVIQHDIRKDQWLSFTTPHLDQRDRYLSQLPNGPTVDSGVVDEDGDSIMVYTLDEYYAAERAGYGTNDGYRAKPLQFAYYAQSSIDWEGMIVNAGLRMDMWNLGKDYEILQPDGSYRKREFDASDRTQIMLSPRLSISHPISERDIIHFAYNYQNQLPQMQYIFTSMDSLTAYSNPGGVTVGNPALEPQITVTYEAGLQHLLTEDYVMGVTLYYKNIYNYVSTKKVKSKLDDTVNWYEYISEDYGSTRGVDVTLNRRLFNFITGGLSYSLAWAHGNNSDTVIQDEQTSLREYPLDWDIRHQFNLNATLLVKRGEELPIPWTEWYVPFSNFNVSFSYDIASGRPYTPVVWDASTALETNSSRMPFTQNANLRITKEFTFGDSSYSIRAYFMIENLFKSNYVNYVYGRSGSPYYDGVDISLPGNNGIALGETSYMYGNYWRNPGYTNKERNYILGLSFGF